MVRDWETPLLFPCRSQERFVSFLTASMRSFLPLQMYLKTCQGGGSRERQDTGEPELGTHAPLPRQLQGQRWALPDLPGDAQAAPGTLGRGLTRSPTSLCSALLPEMICQSS